MSSVPEINLQTEARQFFFLAFYDIYIYKTIYICTNLLYNMGYWWICRAATTGPDGTALNRGPSHILQIELCEGVMRLPMAG